jgi:thioredoxin-like negative regulator of GroEL
MSVPAALITLAVLLAVSTALAVLLRRRSGRGREVTARPDRQIPLVEGQLGSVATFVQFGTDTCAPCHVAARRIKAFTAEHPGVVHLELDTVDHPDLASRLNIISAPTTFLLDAGGAIRVRFSGAPRPEELARHLTSVSDLTGADNAH